jgi:hypothetical protein
MLHGTFEPPADIVHPSAKHPYPGYEHAVSECNAGDVPTRAVARCATDARASLVTRFARLANVTGRSVSAFERVMLVVS